MAAEKKRKAKRESNSRPARWARACAKAREGLEELEDIRSEYEEWKDGLPDNLQSSALADKLETVCGIDIQGAIDVVGEAEDADLPLGFGRD